MYTTSIRSTGVGWAIGMGRLGGIMGPILGGILVGWGMGMSESFLFFAIPSLLAGIIAIKIHSK
jgi:MFS family permease